MRYQGQFRSLKDNLYTVEIITNGVTQSGYIELTLGANPFTTEMDGSSETIYTPLKASTATVEIIGSTYLFDLYSSTAKQNAVTLYDASSNVIWAGYTTPNTYSSPYDHPLETYTVECVDGLGVLQYFDYKPVSMPSNSTDVDAYKGFVTFAEIVNHILSTAGCFRYWYYSQGTSIIDHAGYRWTGSLMSQLTISEQNFFDEDNKAMKMNEVLEEICKFCGVTAVAQGDKVFFIDYDYVKDGYSNYTTYTVGSASYTGLVTLKQEKTLSKEDYAETGSNLSLCNTYNKVIVKDSLYSLDSIIPSMFENEDLKNIQGYPWTTDKGYKWSAGYEGYTSSEYIGGKDKIWGDVFRYFGFTSRFYLNDKYNSYFYTLGGSSTTPSFTQVSNVNVPYDKKETIGAKYSYPPMINNTVGALFCKMKNWMVSNDDGSKRRDRAWAHERLVNGKHGSADYTDYLLLHLNDSSNTNQKLLEINTDKYKKPFFISNKANIVITGSLQVDDRENCPVPLSDYEESNDTEFYRNDLILKTGLKCGNKYWNGTTWTTTNSTFNLPFYDTDVASNVSFIDGHFNGTEFKISTTNVVADNSPSDGYLIHLPSAGTEEIAIANVPQFSLYGRGRFRHNGTYGHQNNYRVDRIWLKDFDIKYYMPYDGAEDKNNTDTEYEYNINADYVKQLGDITFKICTWDGKQANYSAVAYIDGSNYYFLDKLYNSATGQSVRAEEQLCYRIVRQYEHPAKKLEVTLFNTITPYALITEPVLTAQNNNTPVKMIVDSVSYNYKYDAGRYTLIEKV